MYKLSIITSHPIQYNAPLFKKLNDDGRIKLKVFYTWDKGNGQKLDPGFGQKIEWDIPLLDDYDFTFVTNVSKKPGSHHFRGIQNPTLIDEIKAFEPDVILVYGWSFQSHLQVMRFFKGKVPIWFRGDSTLLDFEFKTLKDVFKKREIETGKQNSGIINAIVSLTKFKIRKIFLTWVYKHVDKAFYVGTNNKEYFLTHGLKEDQLIWMPHAVDNEFFQRDESENELKAKVWKKGLGINNDDFVILFAGKFEPKKNPELLLKAVIEINKKKILSPRPMVNQRIDDKLNPIHLILVGNGILEEKLKTMASGKDYIHFLPFQNQSQMPIVYRLGDVFCLPSQGPGESWGLAVNESMASGKPIIVSNKVGCAIDLVCDGYTGYIFQHQSMSDLVYNINIFQKVNLSEFGKNCKNKIKSWSYKTDCLIDQFK